MSRTVLHIGLPKTGTTYLQQLFEEVGNINYISKVNNPEFVRYLRNYLRGDDEQGLHLIKQFNTHSTGINIISDENISLHWLRYWNNDEPTPSKILYRIRDAFPDLHMIIFGVRKQDTWLASRYAESTKNFEIAGQEDFENRVGEVLTRIGEDWLDYGFIVNLMRDIFGEDRVQILHQECLDFSSIERNLGINLQATNDRVNSLQISENVWELNAHSEYITLTDELSEKITQKYGNYTITNT